MRILTLLCVLVGSSANAEVFLGDWSIDGLSYNGKVYNELTLDLDVLPRFVDVSGIIHFDEGAFFRPIYGTCVIEGETGDVVCTMRLDALSLFVRVSSGLSGSIDLIDAQTTEVVSSGSLSLLSFE